ncbi:MAG TPA: outer membrane lipoprotein carrier protein LolA [Polyangiaceae bacterium]|jgi:outer membrane lipoprotein-sorting protein|nr:outer membrane lipoprotein carrier protein LolA [Polyangiaceae bacterium]
MRWLPARFPPALGVGLALVLALAAGAIGPRSAFASGTTASGNRAPADGPVTIDSLLARFRGVVGLSARFHEEKHIAMLAQPLVSEGTVHYAPPGKIARHTLTPSASSVVLDGTTLRFGDATSERSIDTGTSPIVRAFVDSFLAVLAGDRAALERSFVLDFHTPAGGQGGSQQKWELGLTPRDASLAHIIREIRFSGDGLVLSQMRIREATGDEGITTFSDVDTAHHYSPAEADRVFRLSP